MGQVLASVVGQKAAASIGSAMMAKQSYDQFRGGDPGSAPLADASSLIPQAPNVGQGFSMASPQPVQSPTMTDQLMPQDATSVVQAPAPQAAAPTDNNPYDGMDLSNLPKEIANSIGTPSQTPDTWKPKNESILGQIGDFLLMRRGMQPIFRNRTDEANIQDAMKGFQDNPSLAISRVAQVDPKAAWQMYTQNTTVEGNKGLQEDRIAGLQDKGREVIGSFAGSILNSPDPAASAKRLLPTMQTMAKTYHLPDDYIGDLTNKDNLASLRDGAITPAQQQSLSISKSNSDRMASIEQQNVDLSKGRLALSAIDTQTGQYNAQTARMNAETAAGKTTQGAKPVFNNDLGGKPAGMLSQDGYNLILMGPDGQPHAWKLRKKGDLNSRMPNPSDDPLVQAARNKALGLNPDGTPKQ